MLRRACPGTGGLESYTQVLATALSTHDSVDVVAQEIGTAGGPGHLALLLRGATFAPFADEALRTRPVAPGLPGRALAVGIGLRKVKNRLGLHVDHDDPRLYARILGPALARAAAGADVLHAMNGGNFASASVAAAHRLARPFVIAPHAHPGQWDDSPADARAYAAADAVVATGPADARTYLDLGVPEERVHVIPPCTAVPSRGGGAALRDQHGLTGPLVVFVGRREAYKGADLVKAAIAELSPRIPGLAGVLLGPGPDPAAEYEGGVLTRGMVDEEEKWGWLEAADVVCLPSSYESFGLVVAEAWSVGTPVVVSQTAALRDLVERGSGGLSVPREVRSVAEALEALLTDPARAAELGRRGRERWLAEHTPERCAAAHHALYARVVDAHSARG